MRFADSLNRLTGKWMPLIVLLCLAVGVVFSGPLGHLTFLVPYVFAIMTFSGAVKSSFRQMAQIARRPLPLAVSFVIIHALIPLLALAAGKILFSGSQDLISGTVLEYVVPSAVSSVMWCSVSGGDMSLTLCIILTDTLTAPLLVPLSLRLLIGSNAQVDVSGMMLDLVWMVVVPALLAMLLNQFSHGRAGEKLSPVLAPYGKLALIFIITVNSTRIAPFVRRFSLLQLEVIAAIFVLATCGYAGGWLAARLLREDRAAAASMTFGCGMRNISAGAVIAAAYFPAEVMGPVMAGTLFQQALAGTFSYLLTKNRKPKKQDMRRVEVERKMKRSSHGSDTGSA